MAEEIPVADRYQQHCASCHGADRLGAIGPALLPENLGRLSKSAAAEVIANGRPATQMPAFGDRLLATQIEHLVEHIYTPLAHVPDWDLNAMQASRIVNHPSGSLPDKPVFSADPLNLFMVVESGDHHVTVLDGDKLEAIYRFPSRFALHGGPKYSRNGRYVYFASRDGWVSKFDIYNLKITAEIRVGINTRNLAVSADDRYVMVGNYLPHTVVVLEAADLAPIRIIAVKDDFGRSSRVSAVYTAPPRESFVVALKDIPEVWEISYSDNPEAIFQGLVHDYRQGEAIADETDMFPVRRIKLNDYLDDFFFDQGYHNILGAARPTNGKESRGGQVVNLIVGRKIADIDLPGLPHLGSGITWARGDTRVIATPNLKEGMVSILDPKTWKTIKRIPTLGPGFFMRSHENSRYAWVDVFFGPHRDAVHVIDKQMLKIVKTLRPAPGKTAAHVEFTRDGRYALLSVWDTDGALVVYDAESLAEVKRLPMVKPSGKYNVYNKTHLSEGTSH